MINAQHIARTSLGIIGQMNQIRRPKFVPEEADLATIIAEAFWASLERYEGVPLRFRLFFVPRIDDLVVVKLSVPTPLSRHEIRALSPAHAASGGLLGNFPQTFSHLGLIQAAARLDLALRLRDEGSSEPPRLPFDFPESR